MKPLVAITGGLGDIGRAIGEAYAAQGDQVAVFTHFEIGLFRVVQIHRHIHGVHADGRDQHMVLVVIAEHV